MFCCNISRYGLSLLRVQRSLALKYERRVSQMAGIKQLPDGIYPTMITPFLNDGSKSVDWNGLDALTEWYIKSGVTGLFSVCLSSEMFQLNNEERVAIARRVVEKAKGRVPVVIGSTFEGGVEEQAKLMNTMGEMADSVVIITNQIAGMEESDEVWLQNCQKLLDMTGNLPLGLYETPVPKVRNLTPKMVRWVAQTGRFNFLKDTSLEMSILLEKIRAAKEIKGSPLKVFTAKTQFISGCIDGGGNGFSGVSPNFFPWLNVWLYQHRNGDQEEREKVQQFLSVADRVIAHKYPTSSKYYLSEFHKAPLQSVCRCQDVTLTGQDRESLRCLSNNVDEMTKDLNIKSVDFSAL